MSKLETASEEQTVPDFTVDISTFPTATLQRRAPILGTLCQNPSSCRTCIEYQQQRRMQALQRTTTYDLDYTARNFRRIKKIFVNALDIDERELEYPVRLLVLPLSVFAAIVSQYTRMKIDIPDINIFHPVTGYNIVIDKDGMGLETVYSTNISGTASVIPNIQVLDNLQYNNRSNLYNLSSLVPQFFNHRGQLQFNSPIVGLHPGRNVIRILPPYNSSKRIHTTLWFHFQTVDTLQTVDTYRENAAINTGQPQQRRELLLINEIVPPQTNNPDSDSDI